MALARYMRRLKLCLFYYCVDFHEELIHPGQRYVLAVAYPSIALLYQLATTGDRAVPSRLHYLDSIGDRSLISSCRS